MNILHVLLALACVLHYGACAGLPSTEIDEDAVDRILEQVQMMNARNVREAAQQQKAKPAKKPQEKKQKAKAKEQGCGKIKEEQEPVTVKEGGRHKPGKVATDEACPPPNLGHPYEVISMNRMDEDVVEEPEQDKVVKPTLNQTAVFMNIINDLKTLKNATASSRGNTTDGIPAHLTGVWLSEIAGLRFSLQERPAPTTTTQVPNHHEHATTHAPRADLRVTATDRRVQPREKLLTTDWLFTATAPAVLGSPFYMVATLPAEKRIAVFIGQAKVCSHQEVIYGGWLFGKAQPAASCRDAELSVWTRNEVMRRGRPAASAAANTTAPSECSEQPN